MSLSNLMEHPENQEEQEQIQSLLSNDFEAHDIENSNLNFIYDSFNFSFSPYKKAILSVPLSAKNS